MTGTVTRLGAPQRERMLLAMTRAVVEKGYARVSVADVVAGARVSRRTFYEHFEDKESCFLAAYESGTRGLVVAVLEAMGAVQAEGWRAQVRAALATYTSVLAAQPDFARTFVLDVVGAGPRAVELRQANVGLFVDGLRALVAAARERDPELGPVTDLVVRGLVGAVSEVVQHHILTEGAASLRDLAPALGDLAIAVVEAGGGLPEAA